MGFTCKVVRGFGTIAPCLKHIRAGGGGSVHVPGCGGSRLVYVTVWQFSLVALNREVLLMRFGI